MCDASTDFEVSKLELPSNNLSGTITGLMGLLIKLESIDLSRNSLSGTIPPDIMIGLTSLQIFRTPASHYVYHATVTGEGELEGMKY